MVLSRLQAFDAAIRRMGIPIDGVSQAVTGDYNTTHIDYRPEATAEQRLQGEDLNVHFDWRARTELERGEIAAGVKGLSETDRSALLEHYLAHLLQKEPDVAEDILANTAVALAVDKVDVA